MYGGGGGGGGGGGQGACGGEGFGGGGHFGGGEGLWHHYMRYTRFPHQWSNTQDPLKERLDEAKKALLSATVWDPSSSPPGGPLALVKRVDIIKYTRILDSDVRIDAEDYSFLFRHPSKVDRLLSLEQTPSRESLKKTLQYEKLTKLLKQKNHILLAYDQSDMPAALYFGGRISGTLGPKGLLVPSSGVATASYTSTSARELVKPLVLPPGVWEVYKDEHYQGDERDKTELELEMGTAMETLKLEGRKEDKDGKKGGGARAKKKDKDEKRDKPPEDK